MLSFIIIIIIIMESAPIIIFLNSSRIWYFRNQTELILKYYAPIDLNIKIYPFGFATLIVPSLREEI